VADLVSAIDSLDTVNSTQQRYVTGRSSERQPRRARELTPSQYRAVMLAQQQVLRAHQAQREQYVRRAQLRKLQLEQDQDFQAAITSSPAVEKKVSSDAGAGISFRKVLGEVLRSLRQSDHKTLREISEKAGVSLGYLSEVERGQKEASSELLGSISAALGKPLSQTLRLVADEVEKAEKAEDAARENENRAQHEVQIAA
jgi:transcriptional regulator with XRE-family HTH domain